MLNRKDGSGETIATTAQEGTCDDPDADYDGALAPALRESEDHAELATFEETGMPRVEGWESTMNLGAKCYRCWRCGQIVSSSAGFLGNPGAIYICPNCKYPTLLAEGRQYPGGRAGNPVPDLPEPVGGAYQEARDCMGASAYTAASLMCRKILMNVAHDQGAKEGLGFVEYVEYLADKHFIPPNASGWVDLIRQKGNEATHEIKPINKTEATQLLTLTEMMLKIIYEFPKAVPATSNGDDAS